MLPVVERPLIQYAVEEAMAAGMTEMIFVTGRSKRAIEDHFDKSYEIEAELESACHRRLRATSPGSRDGLQAAFTAHAAFAVRLIVI